MENQFIIYGAGKRGVSWYNFLKQNNLNDNIYGFCDKNYKNIQYVDDKKVYSYEEVKNLDLPFFVSIVDEDMRNDAIKFLKSNGNFVENDLSKLLNINAVEYNRMYCAFFHIKNMDKYFDDAESQDWLNVFWGENTLFYQMFKKLDITDVIELAVGRGRHVQKYIDKANSVTVVDIIQKNIDICKERYKNYDNIKYYCNNGYDLSKLSDNSYTAVFSYDAMVHFEMLDIYNYLKEMYRVLKNGGCALIHHSNNHSDYKASFQNAVQGRNYMSKDLFAYLAYREGFEIVEQHVIDWKPDKDLDCISLIKKKI